MPVEKPVDPAAKTKAVSHLAAKVARAAEPKMASKPASPVVYHPV